MPIGDEIVKSLFALQDEGYRKFHAGLLPTADFDTIIGVRMPALRAYAKTLRRRGDVGAFLAALPHRYYEENNLHALLINAMRDYGAALAATDAFLPFVDNWATCDLLNPAAFAACPPGLPAQARRWMASDHTYTIRFGIGVLMRYYLDGRFSPEYAEAVAALRSEEYYVNMMIAWYFATALAKQWDAALPFLRERRLDRWAHNKAIQKAIESCRVTEEHKAQLRALRWGR